MSDSVQPHGILQATILEWGAFPFSRGSSQARGLPHCRQILYQMSHRGSPRAGIETRFREWRCGHSGGRGGRLGPTHVPCHVYFILLNGVVRGVVPFISLCDFSLLVYRNARDVCVLILCPAPLLNSLMRSSSFLMAS